MSTIYTGTLQKRFYDFNKFVDYNKNVKPIFKILGFKSEKEAWDSNPIITGDMNLKNYKIVKENVINPSTNNTFINMLRERDIKKIPIIDLVELKKFLKGPIPTNIKISMSEWQKFGGMVNVELGKRKETWKDIDRDSTMVLGNIRTGNKVKKLEPTKDYGKYRSPIKETNMKTYTLDRLEKMILKEEITDQKVENPLQSTGSTPEPKDIDKMGGQQPPKAEEPKPPVEQKPEDNQPHTAFMDAAKTTMEKVKANQIVTWEELKKLSELFDKIVK